MTGRSFTIFTLLTLGGATTAWASGAANDDALERWLGADAPLAEPAVEPGPAPQATPTRPTAPSQAGPPLIIGHRVGGWSVSTCGFLTEEQGVDDTHHLMWTHRKRQYGGLRVIGDYDGPAHADAPPCGYYEPATAILEDGSFSRGYLITSRAPASPEDMGLRMRSHGPYAPTLIGLPPKATPLK
ncbi:MAG: hypothetical protein H6741_24165 [Alphaproteobacteria bacterium]|nr:hypothetical protein [Alphaproteobacteria bacterium]